MPARDLVLNFFPATFSEPRATAWVGRWESPEQADQLRASRAGLVTWRDRADGDRMYAWHPTAVLPETFEGLSRVTVRPDEAPQLFERLVTDAVGRRMHDLGFEEKGNGFVNFSKGSLLAKVPQLVAVREPIGIYPKILFDVFFTKDANDELRFGLTADVLYTTRLDVSAAEWVAAGLADTLRSEYVCLLPDAPEAARFPELRRRTLGRLTGFRNDNAVLSDARLPELTEIPLTSVAPEPTRMTLERYLEARYEAAYRGGEAQLQRQLRDFVRPASRLDLIQKALGRLQPKELGALELLPGLTVSFSDLQVVGTDAFPVRPLDGPTYSFDRAGDKLERRIDTGLKRYGPYDRQAMASRGLRLLVVAPTANKGDVEVAIPKLLGGIRSKENVFTGLRAMYRLSQIEVTTEFVPVTTSQPMAGYLDAVRRALTDESRKVDAALVVIHEPHRRLPDSENPYFQTKGLLLTLDGIPTQAVTVEKLRTPDATLQYILNTLALALYAKLGGVSHVLRLAETKDSPTELVFGVGRALTRKSRLTAAEETVGFATVFRANGEYLYNDCTPYCTGAAYERALEDTIRRTVDKVAAFEQLADDASVRLVFHVHRRPGRHEVQPILNAVRKLPRFRIEFALVHVNDDHHLQLFDRANVGAPARGGRPAVDYLPVRGLAVTLGPRERLVTFVGPDQYRGQGCPGPLRLTLDKASTFTDIEYLTQQLYLLSFMSARSLSPGIKPVTIAYAEQLARMTGHLRGVQAWTVDVITRRLTRRLWFI
jgi:Piwi domain